MPFLSPSQVSKNWTELKAPISNMENHLLDLFLSCSIHRLQMEEICTLNVGFPAASASSDANTQAVIYAYKI